MEINNKMNEPTGSVQSIAKDALTVFLRDAAQTMLTVAIEQEVADFMRLHQGDVLEGDLQRVVRNGHLPERDIQTGIGNMAVKVPRVRDRGAGTIKYNSSLIPKYIRRTATMEVLLPLLYLKGISTNDFRDILEPIFGEKAKNLSPNVIAKLKSTWNDQRTLWQKRDLSDKKYVYIWADGINLKARMESEKSSVLVLIGVDEKDRKELLAMDDGFRESKEGWVAILNDLKSRGLICIPKMGIGDGALGFWAALNEVFPETTHQRCWVHKTGNILDKLPRSQQEKAKSMVQDIYMAATREDAEKAWKQFISTYEAKYPKAVTCLVKDQQELLAFYDFPAEHWVHIRTTNPIESTFATVRHASDEAIT